MSQFSPTPEVEGQVSDAVSGNWVDQLAPRFSRPYLRLSRADRPVEHGFCCCRVGGGWASFWRIVNLRCTMSGSLCPVPLVRF